MNTTPLNTVDVAGMHQELTALTNLFRAFSADYTVVQLAEIPEPLWLKDPVLITHSGIVILVRNKEPATHSINYTAAFYHPLLEHPIRLDIETTSWVVYSATSDSVIDASLKVNPDEYDPIDVDDYIKELSIRYPRYIRLSDEMKHVIAQRYTSRFNLTLPTIDPM